MGKLLERFRGLVADDELDSVRALAREFAGRSVLHVYTGGLRADAREMVENLAEYYDDLGLQYRATTLVGLEQVFDASRLAEKNPGNSGFSASLAATYEEVMQENARKTFLHSDMVIIHGLQPIGLVEHRREDCPWLWRCHADLSRSSYPLWSFVKRFAPRYQGAIFSHADFVPNLRIPRFVVEPSIDPFGPVNEAMSPRLLKEVLAPWNISPEQPQVLFLLQSDSAEEALEAIRTWKRGHFRKDALLVLVRIGGSETASGPELEALRALDHTIRVIRLSRRSTREICALGWAAKVVVDLSDSPWPNLDVLNVMWKRTVAVVGPGSATASFVPDGGGYRIRTNEQLACRIGELLEDPRTARSMGAVAHRSIVDRHLVPRRLLDYLKLLLHFESDAARG